MTTVNAIFRNGMFQPTERVELPENSRVQLQVECVDSEASGASKAVDEIYRIMGLRFHSGERDVAERHDEHQP